MAPAESKGTVPRPRSISSREQPGLEVLHDGAGRRRLFRVTLHAMAAFTPGEIAYLQSQRLGRIATAANGQPHVVPVTFRYNPAEDAIEIGGHGGFAKRKKYRDVQQNPRVAFVVDDIVSVQPWKVRGIEIRGEVEILLVGGSAILPHMEPGDVPSSPSQDRELGDRRRDDAAERSLGGLTPVATGGL